MCEQKKLACGGRGPCCHIGYAHRHCEHCDFVISLHTCRPNPWLNNPLGPLGQPLVSQLGSLQIGTGAAASDFPSPPKVFAMNSSGAPERAPLPDATAHVCDVT